MYENVPSSKFSPSKNGMDFIPMTAPSATRSEGEPTCPVSYFGSDTQYRNGGNYDSPDWTYLPVALQSINENFDFDITEDGGYVPVEDYSGPGSSDYDRDSELQYVSVDVEWDALDRWHDQDPNECTTLLGQPTTNGFDNYIGDEARNAYVEGNEGFTSRKLLDDVLTRKYHARLLNVFLDRKTSEIRIGSMRIVKTEAGMHAECVAGYCGLTSPIVSKDITRENMEVFVMALIRHGNNHAAKWFKEKVVAGVPTWYGIHDFSCDATHRDGERCNNNKPRPVIENEVEFLMEHQVFCRDARCKCDERIAELAPVLARAS